MSANRYRPIDASTRFCAVYGHPIRHSASPALQNAGIAALQLNWRYLAFEVHPEDLSAALAGAGAMRFVGLNLTVPHKQMAVELVDELGESARKWGAVNTVRFEARSPDGAWQPLACVHPEEVREIRSVGYNTDAEAIARSLREDLALELRGASVLLLGAGGAGRVAALKLAEEGVSRLFLVNRTPARSESVAAEIRERFDQVEVKVGYPKAEVDLLLNATSLGLAASDPLPYDEQQFSLGAARAVYDMVYRPAETRLLQAAATAGCRVANGVGMLLYQGAAALEIWSGQPAPIPVMRRALEENLYRQPSSHV